MMNARQSTKGQITLFVIIGLVLFLGATIFFIISSSLQMEKPNLDIPDVSLEARPANEIVHSCLATIGEEAMRKIGSQGGTLHPPTVRYPPYRSEAIDFAPDIVPYWRYLEDCPQSPSGCEKTFEPPLCRPTNKLCSGVPKGDNSIQESVEEYIEKNIPTCVNNFKDIGKQYDVSIEGEPKAEVFFLDGETDFKLNYPLKITSLSTSNTEEIQDFVVKTNLNFYSMYTFAREILDFERKTNYFEQETLDLITIFSGRDMPLPPMAGFSIFGQSMDIWVQEEVKNVVQNDLLPYMNIVRFMNTKNYYPLVDDYSVPENYTSYAQGIYSKMSPKTSNHIYPFDTTVNYLYQPIFLRINDGEQIIKPSSIDTGDLGPFAKMMGLFMKDYRFKYFISYPLLIGISDPDAFGGRGYSFNFGLEVNIRNNLPGYYNFTTIDTPIVPDVNINMIEQRPNQTILIKTSDRHTGEPLDDVVITYVCGKEYDVGLTAVQSDGEAELKTTLPYCEYGGFIRYQKTGYLGESFAYNNRINGTNQSFEFDLWPVQKREVIIKKRSYADLLAIQNAGSNAFVMMQQQASNLSQNQEVLLNLEREKQTPYDTDVPIVGFLRYIAEPLQTNPSDMYNELKQNIMNSYNQGLINESERDELLSSAENDYQYQIQHPNQGLENHYYVDLVPGTYSVDMTLLDRNGIHIPPYTLDLTQNQSWLDKISSNLLTSGVNSTIELPEQNISIWQLGGAKFNFSLSEYRVYKDRPIVFYVLEMKRPETWPDLMNLQSLEDYQKGKELYLNPQY